jgi:predicted acylesterase/phospholipase RssA
VIFVAGCTSIHRNPVPVDLADRAVIPGMPHVRDWGDEPSSDFQDDLVQSVVDQQSAGTFVGHQMPLSALLLSGGGSNGAFGAGFLSGWSEAGSRPTFKLVTGISTGALLAPFAFLGSDYDPDLERLYTTTTTGQIYRFRNPLTVLKKDSLTRTDPLAETLREIIDAPLLAEIADQHRRGRRLYVGTTNLDAQRLMVWNMGAIAAGGNPSALELFRQVLLASASIPVAFPPVYIPVDVDGVAYDEMHVDGGVVAEFFLWGAMVDIAEALGQLGVDPSTIEAQIFIIRNSQIDPEPVPVEPRLTHIAERSMITVLKSVAVGDLLRIWAHAQRNGVGFNFIGIPVDQPEANVAAFDPKDMRRLYDLGRSMALEPKPWRQRPPFVIPD